MDEESGSMARGEYDARGGVARSCSSARYSVGATYRDAGGRYLGLDGAPGRLSMPNGSVYRVFTGLLFEPRLPTQPLGPGP